MIVGAGLLVAGLPALSVHVWKIRAARAPRLALTKRPGLWSAVLLAGLLALPAQAAVQYQRLKSFGSTTNDGGNPRASVTQGTDRALYGTTLRGGGTNKGTVFRLNRDGSGYAIVHDFGIAGWDGTYPRAGVIQASDGALYGTTTGGGSNDLGTVFKLNKDGGGYVVLHHCQETFFDDSNANGLVEGSDGVLYGTMYGTGSGTLFKLNKDGSGFRILHPFGSVGGPQSEPIEGSDGALYGTTGMYGGTVYRINKDGTGYTVLHSFGDTGDGKYPNVLIEGEDGVLYCTTSNGGSDDRGIVFKINRDGSAYSILYSFNITGGDGQSPFDGLTEGSDGMLYGTTAFGGSGNFGTIFRLNKDGSGYNTLRSFSTTGLEGKSPRKLILAADRAFYSTTYNGGDLDFGTVFRFATAELIAIVPDSTGGYFIRFNGIPGSAYRLQRATSVSGPWTSSAPQTAPASGLVEFRDLFPPPGQAFYRTVQP
jgi:uncharacterized repeat protein (TIGR03803 family)